MNTILLIANFMEAKLSEIAFNDLDSHSLQLAVDFIYTASLDIPDESVEKMFETASFLQLSTLEKLCTRRIIEKVDMRNCIDFRFLAEKYCNDLLLSYTKDFIRAHLKTVIKTNSFLQLPYEEIVWMLDGNLKFNVHSNNMICLGLLKWVEHNRPIDSSKSLEKLLNFIHPAYVGKSTKKRLMRHQKKNSSIKGWLDQYNSYKLTANWQVYILEKFGRVPSMMRIDLSNFECKDLQPPPKQIFAFGSVAHKNVIYVQGGKIGRATCQSYYYDIFENKWHELQSLLAERSHHRTLYLNESLYALGGTGPKGTLSTVERLNLATNQSFFVRGMSTSRSSLGAVVIDNAIYALGGDTSHSNLYSVERYDPRVGDWEPLPTMHIVSSYCCSALLGNYIYCCEGNASCLEYFDLRNQNWSIANFWHQREFFDLFSLDDKLYSTSAKTIAHFDTAAMNWIDVYEYSIERDWDYGLPVQVFD